MERPKMNRKAHRSGPVERSDSQFKNPENPSNRPFFYPYIQEAASSSRTYDKHHFPGPYTSDISMRPGQDQDSDVIHRFCSKWRPPATCSYLTDFQEILTGYLSVAQGHFFEIFCSSWDSPSTGIPIDAWC